MLVWWLEDTQCQAEILIVKLENDHQRHTTGEDVTFVVQVQPTVKSGELDDSAEIFQLFHRLLQNASALLEPRQVQLLRGKK